MSSANLESSNPMPKGTGNGNGGLSLLNTLVGADEPDVSFDGIDAELKAFEKQERERLGLVDQVVEHWFDANPQKFTKAQRATTTILLGGLTRAQDYLVTGALNGIGY